MDPLALFLTFLGLLIAGLGSWYTYLTYSRGHVLAPDGPSRDLPESVSLLSRLLALIGQYPEKGGNHASWAVKESLVLRGRLEDAAEQPGLGVAVVTIDLVGQVFGALAEDSRIDGCVAWALAHAYTEPPYLLKGKSFDSRTSEWKEVPDFRHTLAFAIILARTGRLKDRLGGYLSLTLNTQNQEGGWPAGEGLTVSEVFTALYALELLSLCGSDPGCPENIRALTYTSRDRGTKWLLSATTVNGLWESGVLKEFVWDDVLTTAWVLHRLAPITGIDTPSWSNSLSRAASSMISKAANPETWSGGNALQRFRVEARVAAAAAAILRRPAFLPEARDTLRIFLSDWRRRGATQGSALPDNEWDLATAVFVLSALYSVAEMQEAVRSSGMRSVLPVLPSEHDRPSSLSSGLDRQAAPPNTALQRTRLRSPLNANR